MSKNTPKTLATVQMMDRCVRFWGSTRIYNPQSDAENVLFGAFGTLGK